LLQGTTRIGNNIALSDGQCQAWANYFTRVLKSGGITTPIDSVKITPSTPINVSNLLVKTWTFPINGGTSQLIPGYPYQNLYSPNDVETRNPAQGDNGVWGYKWGTVNEFNHVPNSGQNNTNPKSHFYNHYIVKINGTYYDPSYGTKATSEIDWQTQSLDGIALSNNVLLVARKTTPLLREVNFATYAESYA
jgi:hypothetical protein